MRVKKERKRIDLKKQNEVEANIRKYANLPIEELYEQFNTSSAGLKEDQLEDLKDKYDKNVIEIGKKNTRFRRLINSIINPFNIILLLIAFVTFLLDVILVPVKEERDFLTVIIIIALVLISAIVAFIQGEKSNKATEQLTSLISNKADVLRDGKLIEVLMEDILPGDIIKLSAGDMIPADIRFISTKDTFIAQSALTGESNPVEKFSHKLPKEDCSITDLENIGFSGSNVISGVAYGVVILTGNNTYFGAMAEQLSSPRDKNSFEKGVSNVSKLLIIMMLIMVPIVFLLNWIGPKRIGWESSLLFAISIAVGLTPELLPVIMTTTLATGAIAMSKHQVIVKDLGSIQTFGQMDILCTDKTGTLTEDKIILEKYMDLNGQSDFRVLRHAYLNSYFQTGLKNMMDVAIIERARKQEISEVKRKYTVVDEIPFDFSRRRMSVVVVDDTGKRQLITKGAVEEMLAICKYAEINGEVVIIDKNIKEIALKTYHKHNNDGLRMIVVAQKNEVPDEHKFGVADESNMVLIGFIGFLDPPKESAKIAISALKDHGIRTVVLTGDSEGVAAKVCKKVGISADKIILGVEVEKMSDEELKEELKVCDLFAKLSPKQKERVVNLFQELNHTVGYLGDGINDALALKQADVGVSVDGAVDIAKETADIILLEKDLMVLEEGVIRGRQTFGNVIKYIKMAVSGNFGNMFAVIGASIFLPFLPMLPVQLLIQNLLNDFSQVGLPFDRVDEDYIAKPRKWNTKSILKFTAVFGPLSSVFDFLTFIVMYFIIGKGLGVSELAPLFQAGWFIFGTLSQILIVHIVRTRKVPFVQSYASKPLIISSIAFGVPAILIAFTSLGEKFLHMTRLPLIYIPWLLGILVLYALSTQLLKMVFIKRSGEWL